MNSVYFEIGQRAYQAGYSIDANPYEEGSKQSEEWYEGWVSMMEIPYDPNIDDGEQSK